MGAVIARAAAGKAGAEALTAIANATRNWAKKHPGRYAATVRAPDKGDEEHIAACAGVLQILLDSLASYQLTGDDATDAARTYRATMHGFNSLEQAGGFGLPVDIDRSFNRLIAVLAEALNGWPTHQSGATLS